MKVHNKIMQHQQNNNYIRKDSTQTQSKRHYRKVRCITRDNVQDAPPKVEEKTWKKPQVH